jgi:uncharacterized protein
MTDNIRVDVAPLAEQIGESLEVSGDLPLDSFEVGTEVFNPTGPAHFDLTITNSGTGIVVMGSVTLPALATCARCLEEFPLDITAEVDGYYIRPGDEEGIPEEQEISYIDAENRIDVLPAMMSALVLEAPFAPVHDESCAGICPTCGADLNQGPCACAEQPGESNPFAALQGLLDERSDAGE